MIKALLGESLRRNRLLASASIAHFVLFLMLLPASFLDPMQILGISRWVKPMKFAISIGIFMMTTAWLLSYLERSRRAVPVLSGIIAVTMTGEMVLITMQAARGVRSHFNNDSVFDGIVFGTMDAAQQLFEVIEGQVRVFQALVVKHEALDDVLPQPLRSPDAELGGDARLDPPGHTHLRAALLPEDHRRLRHQPSRRR